MERIFEKKILKCKILIVVVLHQILWYEIKELLEAEMKLNMYTQPPVTVENLDARLALSRIDREAK